MTREWQEDYGNDSDDSREEQSYNQVADTRINVGFSRTMGTKDVKRRRGKI